MTGSVVIVGAGMGGLSAALDLASTGHAVTVLERASAPGGKLRETMVGDAAIDSGPTVFTMRYVFEDLFRDAGLDFADHVALDTADILARHSWPDGSRLDLFADVEQSAAAIESFADRREADAYRRFASRSAEIFETLDQSFMRRDKPGPVELSLSLGVGGAPKLYRTKPFVTLWNELGRIFRDPRLRQLFARYATYCGSSPLQAPATLMLIAHAERAGVWLVRGGMQRLAEAIASAAQAEGAEIRYDCDVGGIEASRGGFTVTTSGGPVRADAVIYNGDVAAFAKGLHGDGLRHAVPDRGRETRSLSAITWCLEAVVTDFPLAHHTVFFGGDYPSEFRRIFDDRSIADEPTVYVCAQDRGGSESQGRPERLFLLVNAPPTRLDTATVERAEAQAFALLERQGLQLSPAAAVRATPADFDARFPGSDGAIYGWPTHGWFGSFRRNGADTSVPGLYCAGGTVHPGPGIPMATLSGRTAAQRVRDFLGRNVGGT